MKRNKKHVCVFCKIQTHLVDSGYRDRCCRNCTYHFYKDSGNDMCDAYSDNNCYISFKSRLDTSLYVKYDINNKILFIQPAKNKNPNVKIFELHGVLANLSEIKKIISKYNKIYFLS